jgi:hypothetical protein
MSLNSQFRSPKDFFNGGDKTFAVSTKSELVSTDTHNQNLIVSPSTIKSPNQ